MSVYNEFNNYLIKDLSNIVADYLVGDKQYWKLENNKVVNEINKTFSFYIQTVQYCDWFMDETKELIGEYDIKDDINNILAKRYKIIPVKYRTYTRAIYNNHQHNFKKTRIIRHNNLYSLTLYFNNGLDKYNNKYFNILDKDFYMTALVLKDIEYITINKDKFNFDSDSEEDEYDLSDCYLMSSDDEN
jgi:hypothetical protein